MAPRTVAWGIVGRWYDSLPPDIKSVFEAGAEGIRALSRLVDAIEAALKEAAGGGA